MQAYDNKGRFLNRGVFHGSLEERLGRPGARAPSAATGEEHTVWIIDDDGRCWKLHAAKGECVEICADDLPAPVRRFLA
ncbi:MAG TPA: hypothetical protein VGK73_08335 [Polyangiaceae bacterium]